ncbi:nodulation-signaling pathway 2 protein-like [Papaver somniferum]|uniref:nodulation-signaling pathway 2 protein-like n=1 Tax=Papaver somniferum TaxID=3469 RepID=UPI000E6FF924|nr:nodulation-signaling pathway 2 protein-like [Papaver somniferum]
MDIFHMGDCNLTSPATSSDSESSNDVFTAANYPTMGNIASFLFSPDRTSVNLELEEFNPTEFSDVLEWMEESENSFPSQQHFFEEESPKASENSSIMNSSEVSSISNQPSLLVFPNENMEVDSQLTIPPLLKAYSEAIENEQPELAQVISRRVIDKVSFFGTTVERFAYYLFQAFETHGDSNYLLQESYKNYEVIFKAWYQILPYGKFAHFSANNAILEAIPMDTEVVHIIDFNLGEGIQWPPVIEAIGKQVLVKITSLKSIDGEWRFEETKKRLDDYAKAFGLNLKVKEMELEQLVNEVMKMKEIGEGKEFFAFNCIVGLPHTGRRKPRQQVNEFLWVAKELVRIPFGDSTCGVITFGDGEFYEESVEGCLGFGSFFDMNSAKSHALLESIESHFPCHLREARMAIECLFVAPNLCAQDWFSKWEESREELRFSQLGLNGVRLSRENLVETKELVREGESLYEVKVEGENSNVMVLEFRGTPLVKFSSWR